MPCKGLPFVVNNNAEFLPFGNLRKLINADKLTVCFFDDLGQATPAVQSSAMQLILSRTSMERRSAITAASSLPPTATKTKPA